jgi:hypothetical protein
MKSRLDLIESTFKSLFEGDSMIFPWMDERSAFLHHLIEAIEECLIDVQSETDALPIHYSLYLNAEVKHSMESQPNWNSILQQFFTDVASELDLRFENNPEITLVSRNSLQKGEVQLRAIPNNPENGRTSVVPVMAAYSSASPNTEIRAMLILEDEKCFPLEKPVINIGRKSSNHLVLNDLRVSRTHAQIRAMKDGFILFDIGSSGGTYVNGERVNQRVLKPGDVISIAGIKLIYAEENAGVPEEPRLKTSEIKPTLPAGE